jgi:outer membrane lipoprotein-sorting protein
MAVRRSVTEKGEHMMRRWMSGGVALLLLAMVPAFVSGCAWMGKAAGKAQAKVENKIDAMDKSYHDSYGQERAKGAPEKQNTENKAGESGSL